MKNSFVKVKNLSKCLMNASCNSRKPIRYAVSTKKAKTLLRSAIEQKRAYEDYCYDFDDSSIAAAERTTLLRQTLLQCCSYALKSLTFHRYNLPPVQLLAYCNYTLGYYEAAFLCYSLLLVKSHSYWYPMLRYLRRMLTHVQPCDSSIRLKSQSSDSLPKRWILTRHLSSRVYPDLPQECYPSYYLNLDPYYYAQLLVQRMRCSLILGWYELCKRDGREVNSLLGSYEALTNPQRKELWLQTQLITIKAILCIVLPKEDAFIFSNIKGIRGALNKTIVARIQELAYLHKMKDTTHYFHFPIHQEFALKSVRSSPNPLDGLLLIKEKLQPHNVSFIEKEDGGYVKTFDSASYPSIEWCIGMLSRCIQYADAILLDDDSPMMHEFFVWRAKCWFAKKLWQQVVSDCTYAMLEDIELPSSFLQSYSGDTLQPTEGDRSFIALKMRLVALYQLHKYDESSADHLLLSELETLLKTPTSDVASADDAIDAACSFLINNNETQSCSMKGFLNSRRKAAKWRRTDEEVHRLKDKLKRE